MLLVPAAAMGSHLVLDSLGSGIMWLWPVSEEAFALLSIESAAGMAVARVFLLVAPLYGLWDRWKRTGESPLDALRWATSYLPRPVAWGGVTTFGVMVMLVMGQRFLLFLVG
jgi:hypothetical protein